MKKWNVLLSAFFAMSLMWLLVLPIPVTATDDGAPGPRFQYAAKFLCLANIPGTSNAVSYVLPGTYQTIVNIHNPTNHTVQFRQKIALPKPPIFTGDVSQFIQETLAPDHVLGVDCAQLATIFGITPIHGFEGFLVIESPSSLDVTAVYTAGPVGGDVSSLVVERVYERTTRR